MYMGFWIFIRRVHGILGYMVTLSTLEHLSTLLYNRKSPDDQFVEEPRSKPDACPKCSSETSGEKEYISIRSSSFETLTCSLTYMGFTTCT